MTSDPDDDDVIIEVFKTITSEEISRDEAARAHEEMRRRAKYNGHGTITQLWKYATRCFENEPAKWLNIARGKDPDEYENRNWRPA